MTTHTETVLILGASGKIGRHFARAFREAGWKVRLYDRKAGDMERQAQGAQLIVNGLNPAAYHDWDRLIPEITAQVMAAARSSGATVLIPGNVYPYGTQPGPWDADTPHRPVARKGRIRAEMEAAWCASDLPAIILRAGDFIDPEGKDDVLSQFVLRNLKSGRITAGGDHAAKHAYAFLPDLARAAVELAAIRARLPRFADIPFAGYTVSILDLKAEIERQSGRSLKLSSFPWWAMRLAAPFWELARELVEMRYLYGLPHELSGAAMRRLLPGFQATPFPEAIAAVLAAQVHPDQPVDRRLLA